MADSDDNKSQEDAKTVESEEPLPPILVKRKQITEGLSAIQRTAGKSLAETKTNGS